MNLFPVFVVGLLGGVHCIGMCGGIVGALSATAPKRPFPVAVAVAGATPLPAQAMSAGAHALLYNLGRIASYTVAGAIAGGLAGGAGALTGVPLAQTAGYWLANLMLIALGLHLAGLWPGVARLEQIGRPLWRRLQPLTMRVQTMDTPIKALGLGALWGWLPCGLVYSMLTTALLSGSAASGAAVMLAFGLGTLPTMLAAGMFGARLKAGMQRRSVRVLCGVVVLAFGVLGLMRAGGALSGLPSGWLDLICAEPHGAEGR